MKEIKGTKEWSVQSVNCVRGCSHDCRYCYAREMAERRRQVVLPGEWAQMVVREKDVRKGRKKVDGAIMFPTTHDITPEVLDPCLEVLWKLIEAGNHVLIVSKPHFECIQAICHQFDGYASQILFRFTIGTCLDGILSYWEPVAPRFAERLHCLVHAHDHGFDTSVSTEPLLDDEGLHMLGEMILPFISDAWWIGKMNSVRSRVKVQNARDEEMVRRILALNHDDSIRRIYDRFKNNPKVKWKESIKKVVGIQLARRAGEDK